MKPALFPVLSLAFVVLASHPAAADESKNISGTYRGTDGDSVTIVHSGSSVRVKPDASAEDLPEQVRSLLKDIELSGSIATDAASGFTIDAQFSKVFEPAPTMKVNFKLTLNAKGAPIEQGLDMKACEWELTMHVFAHGEIAGSENRTQSCAGLWKKQ